jgi:hypothetical protein
MNRVRLKWKRPTLTVRDVFDLCRCMDCAEAPRDRTLRITGSQWNSLFRSMPMLTWSEPLMLFGIKLEREPWRP